MEEIMPLSVETRIKAGKVLRVSCGVSVLFCRFSMNDHTPMMSMYSHVICLVNETSFRIVGELQLVERYIDSSGQLFIWMSEKVEASLIIVGHQFSRFLTLWFSQEIIPIPPWFSAPQFVWEKFKVHQASLRNFSSWCSSISAPWFSSDSLFLVVETSKIKPKVLRISRPYV